MEYAFANANALWCATIAESLFRKGVAYAITCPGSRSSPLTFALAEHAGIEAIPILDERSAAFFGLGLAKRTGKPVALICTSGSAVANFFPAIVEASEAGLPLVVITADRPPELRNCAAGQTIDQVKIYGGFVRFQAELAVPENDVRLLRYLRQTVSRAVDFAVGTNPGPTHLNAPFRDPLIPAKVEGFAPCLSAEGFYGFFDELGVSLPIRYADASWLETATASERGLVLIGPQAPAEEEAWARNLSDFLTSLRWPVLADPLNLVRSRAEWFPYLITGYEFILRSREILDVLAPDRIIVIGELPTSKALRQWIESMDLPMTVVATRQKDVDATLSRSRTALWSFETDTLPLDERDDKNAFTQAWLEADRKVDAELATRMEAEDELFEGKLSWALSKALPAGVALCVSNSMPPRDLEFYFGKASSHLCVYGSRGANGIDGIVSTAFGVAHDGMPTYLLVGDLAFLHDGNAGLLLNTLRGSLTILLVDNSGGGIFEMLPVSQFGDVFEKHFVTEQNVDFEQLASAYGYRYCLIENWSRLAELLREPPTGARILHLRTDRKRDTEKRKRWFKEIAERLEQI